MLMYISFIILAFWQKICHINTVNRSLVRYQQTTGSRSYTAHLENLVCQDLPVSYQKTAMGVLNLLSGVIQLVLCLMHVVASGGASRQEMVTGYS